MRQTFTHGNFASDDISLPAADVAPVVDALSTPSLGGCPDSDAPNDTAGLSSVLNAAMGTLPHNSQGGDPEEDDEDPGDDDMPAAAGPVVHLHAGVSTVLTADLRVGNPSDGNSPHNNDQDNGQSDAWIHADASVPGLLHADLTVGTREPADSEDNDNNDDGSSGAEDSDATSTTANGVNISAAVAGITADASLLAAQPASDETPPADDQPGDTGNDTGTEDASDVLLSGATADLLDALSDIYDTECGCEDDGTDAGTGDGSGDGTGAGDDGGNGSSAPTGTGNGIDFTASLAAIEVQLTAAQPDPSTAETAPENDTSQPGDTSGDGGDGGMNGDGNDASAGNNLVDVSLSLAGAEVDLTVGSSAGQADETPSDDDNSQPGDTSGDTSGDGMDGSDASFSGVTSDLLDAISNISDAECGCENEGSGTGAGDDTTDGSGDSMGDGSGSDGTGQDAGTDDGAGDLLAGPLLDVDLQIDTTFQGSAETDAGSGENGTGSGDPGSGDTGSGTDGGSGGDVLVAAELTSALANVGLNASVGLPGAEDLSLVGASMEPDNSGNDGSGSDTPDSSPSGLDLGLGSSSNDDCGCHHDSLAHGI